MIYEYIGLKIKKAQEAQPGRAELWRCLGCKFKSYLEHRYLTIIYKNGRVGIGRQVSLRMEWLTSCKFESCRL